MSTTTNNQIVEVTVDQTNEDVVTTVPMHTLQQESAKREQYVQSIKTAIANGQVRRGRRVEANAF